MTRRSDQKSGGLIPDLIQGENGFIQILSRIIPYFIPDKSKFYPRSDPYFTPDLIHILSRIIIYFIPDFSLNFTADHITSTSLNRFKPELYNIYNLCNI